MGARIFSVDLVDDDDRLQFVLQRLAQSEARLRLRPIVGIDDQKHAVHHFHDALDFAPEIRVPRRVDDVDPITVPMKSRVFRANGDSLLALEIHRIHNAFLDFLIGAKRARLAQQLIDQRSLAVIDVRNDGDITDFIHSRDASSGERSVDYRRDRSGVKPSRREAWSSWILNARRLMLKKIQNLESSIGHGYLLR